MRLMLKTNGLWSRFSLHSRYTITCRAFQSLNTGDFHQDPPQLHNQYTSDWFLQTWLKNKLPAEVMNSIEPDLVRFGHEVASSIYDLHLQCEREQPTLEQYDAWGRRVDKLNTSAAWKAQKTVSAKEGLIAIGYERTYGQYSRIYQMAKLFLYSPSSGLYGCPLAMTDGAARTIEVNGVPSHLQQAYDSLTSRDPAEFWTSGQWMTEKGGGSDVANGTETLAYPQTDGTYTLHGYKWFSSATDSDMSLALARTVNEDGSTTKGTRGLSMFYLKTRQPDCDRLNNIQIVKLKDKLGTRQLPTAELLLCGTKAHLVGELGRGVASISDMLTISRMYNSLFASSATRRIVELCKDFSIRRYAFGSPIYKYPLHMRTLANMELKAQSSALLSFELSRLLGLDECGSDKDTNPLLIRLLTPLAKLYTAKVAMSVTSEGLECFGGQGYIEDTGLPAMLRDAQVLPIWEGTTNICSLDVLRAIEKTGGEVISAYVAHCRTVLRSCVECPHVTTLITSLDRLVDYMALEFPQTRDKTLRARELAFSLANLYIGVLFAEMRHANPTVLSLETSLKRWCDQDLLPIITATRSDPNCEQSTQEDFEMVMSSMAPNHNL